MHGATYYDDGRIACDDHGVLIRWYYPWGNKLAAYSSIRAVRSWPLSRSGRRRLRGSRGVHGHWYGLNASRKEQTGIEIDIGRLMRPVITPDEPDEVLRIIEERLAAS